MLDELEHQHTLTTATRRYETLRTRDALAGPPDGVAANAEPGDQQTAPLSAAEALEMLALGEVIARKASYGRQLSVRSARAAGASWSQIGSALGTSRQAAWEGHHRWIDEQANRANRQGPGHWGWDDSEAAAARALAGDPEQGQ